MLKNMNIMPKIVLGFACLILINLVIGVTIYANVASLRKDTGLTKEALAIKDLVLEYEIETDQEHVLIQDFLNSSDIAIIESLNQAIAQNEESYRKILKAFETQPEEYVHALENVYKRIGDWRGSTLNRQLELVKSPETFNMARAIGLSQKTKDQIAAIREGFHGLTGKIDSYYQSRMEQSNKTMNMTVATVVGGSIILIIVSIAAAAFFGKIIVSPLKDLVTTTEELRQRNWNITVAGTDREDEIGLMAKSLEIFRVSGIEADEMKEQQEKENEIKIQRTNRIEQLVNNFEKEIQLLMNDLGSVANEMQATSVKLNQVVEETNTQTSAASAMAEAAGTNVQNVASATEELTISINEISRQLQAANSNSLQAEETVNEAVGYIKNLEESASQISGIISLITDIAEQTNLLALNATIESARAGEAGKGFSVVANEVKSLATETAKATEEISRNIQTLQEKTGVATDAISRIASMVRAMNEASTAVSSTMEEQSIATQDIARNISDVAQGTSDVTNNLLNVNDNTKQTESAAGNVMTVSQRLKEQSEKLQSGVSTFIQGIRNA